MEVPKMTTTQLSANEQLAHERRSAGLMIGLLLISLLLGWQVKTAVQNATRSINHSGITAAVPDGWLVQDGSGDLVFVARNPQAFDQLYRASRVPAQGDLDVLAENRNLARTRLDETYRVLDTSPIVFDGRDAYKVSFARADADSPGMPHVIEGVDYYFIEGEEVVILSLESQSESFAEALPYFQKFVQSISYNGGG